MDQGEPVMTAAEYAESVNQWLHQAYNWQMLAVGFPSYLAYQAQLRQQQRSSSSTNPATATTSSSRAPTPRVQEFSIPPIWKRLLAEFFDFLFLFIVKLAVTFVAVDTFEIFDFESFMKKYDTSLYSFLAGEELDIDTAFELTSDIVLLELVHRLVVCTYEAICTYKGPLGTPGGATPGKLLMGLRIFRCDEISFTADPNLVRISPASDLGLFWASLRSVLKNMSMAFLFPVCATFLFLPFNRTVYDVMSRSIVVEVSPTRRRR